MEKIYEKFSSYSPKGALQMDNNQNGIFIKKKHIIIFVVIFLLILAGCVFLLFRRNNESPDEEKNSVVAVSSESSSPKAGIELDPNAGNYNGETPEDKGGEEVGIKIPGYPSITILADTENVTMSLLNPEGNPCYFHFTIVLNENDEVIYESKYVPPGQAITDVTLSRPLPVGEYPATIQISTIALDGETPLNGANVETVLIAK